jgi:histidine ammonia-lyase
MTVEGSLRADRSDDPASVVSTVQLSGHDLSVADVVAVARNELPVRLADGARERVAAARAVVEAAVSRGDAIYGLTVGVGSRARSGVNSSERDAFGRLLLHSHRVGQGPLADPELVRAAMVVLANGLASGRTMATPQLVERLVDALNEQRHPSVRLLGSVGEADVAPMVDLAVGLLDGDAPALGEGLVLLSNNAFSTGIAALAIADCERLLDASAAAAALDLEAFAVNADHLDVALAEARPYPGLRAALDTFGRLLDGSSLWEGTARNFHDPLSFRNTPQVHGAVLEALAFARGQIAIELNAAQTNPIVDVTRGRLVRGGNFEALPLALALDFIRIALASSLTNSAERAVKLLQAPHTGLPDGLAAQPDLAEDGLAELDRAAYALAAEARLLAAPVSFELAGTSISEGIEDRMNMAPLSARRLAEMVALGERIVAIELVIGAQALELRAPSRVAGNNARTLELVRQQIPFTGAGEPVPPDLEPIRRLVRTGRLGSGSSTL